MLIEWSRRFAIGVPVVDAEHRYLCELINDLHDAYLDQRLDAQLGAVFSHLAAYTRKHFTNEEALMASVGYPDLEGHREQHQWLLQTVVGLSEDFIDGSASIREDTMAFLKDWVMNHILESDMKIGAYIAQERALDQLELKPAFAEDDATILKRCTLCGKVWPDFSSLAADREKHLKGVQVDSTNHLYNLILYNCSCGTTLALSVRELVGKVDLPFTIEERTNREPRPDHCLLAERDGPCVARCACAYTARIVATMR